MLPSLKLRIKPFRHMDNVLVYNNLTICIVSE